MTRFADLTQTRRVELGPCECPPVNDAPPHDVDVVEVHAELGYKVLGQVQLAGLLPDGRFSFYEAKLELIERGIVRWDLRGPNGKVMQINRGSIGLMREADIEKIATVLDEVVRAGEEPVPNDSSVPSATGSAENASSPPTPPTPAQSTTA